MDIGDISSLALVAGLILAYVYRREFRKKPALIWLLAGIFVMALAPIVFMFLMI